MLFSAVGSVVWVAFFVIGGYFLGGNIPVTKDNYHFDDPDDSLHFTRAGNVGIYPPSSCAKYLNSFGLLKPAVKTI